MDDQAGAPLALSQPKHSLIVIALQQAVSTPASGPSAAPRMAKVATIIAYPDVGKFKIQLRLAGRDRLVP